MQVQSLAYVIINSTDLSKWSHYATQVCGLMPSTSMKVDSVAGNPIEFYKMDHRAFRYGVQKAEFDGLFASGWKLKDAVAFKDAMDELSSKKIPFEKIEDETFLASRSANELMVVSDPSGNVLEIMWEDDAHANDGVDFASSCDVEAFITTAENGVDMGLGHVVLHAPVNFEDTHAFYESIGFLDSDITDLSAQGMGKIYFMNCNPRHHSLALWSWGAPTPDTEFRPSPESKAPGCVHLMMEVGSLAEVGSCLDRVNENEVMVTSTLGEHINDEMTSFYMLSPGNFAVEFGFEGNQLDESHQTTHNTVASKWGHKWTG
ncbi:MAG: VOC family protein [Pseudomonadota bacterium]